MGAREVARTGAVTEAGEEEMEETAAEDEREETEDEGCSIGSGGTEG